MSDKLDKLRQERDKTERQLRKATNDEKALGETDKSRADAPSLHLRRYAGSIYPRAVLADRQ